MSRRPLAAGGTWTSHSSAASGTGESGLSERRGAPAQIRDRQVRLERGRTPHVSPASCLNNPDHPTVYDWEVVHPCDSQPVIPPTVQMDRSRETTARASPA